MAKKVRNDASGGEKQAAHPKPRAQNYKLPKLHAKRNEDVIDERLVDRVRQFMATTGGSENIVTTLQYLRTNYGEYRSKPLRAFKETVLRVINIVNNEKVKEGLILNTDNEVNSDFGESFSEASSSSDEEEVEEEPKRNTFNKIILNNYKKIQEAKKQQQEQQQQQQNTNDAESKEQPQPQPQQVDAVPSPSPQFLLPSADASASTSAPTESNGNTTEKKSKNSEMDDKQKNKRKTEESAAPSDEAENSKRPSKKGKKGRDGREPSTPNGQNSGYLVINKPVARYSDLGGIESILQDVRELVEWPLTHPEIYAWMGVEPPRGILLHGPPGCGKTLLACAIAGEVGVPFFKISAPEIVSGMSGESEAKLRDLFKDATKNAPSLIFIDEIDAITPKRETAQREMERRIVAQLLTCMDELTMEKTGNKSVIVIGATNRPDSLDPALRRAGRFDREISLGIPDEKARANILRVMSTKLRLSGDFDFDVIAKKTPGFVGADLNALTKEAAVIAMNRIFNNLFKNAQKHTPSTQVEEVSNDKNVDQMEVDSGDSGSDKAKTEAFDSNNIFTESSNRIFSKGPSTNLDTRLAISTRLKEFSKPLTPEQLAPLSITMADFEEAITKVQPSSKREGFATIPDVTWKDIGALEDIRQELNLSITEPIKTPERFTNMGLSAPVGVLLYGPPGCGKTLLAKAISNESGANFISIKGPELLNKYVGESERAVRQVFARGRASAPCVIFFDELDALCPRRGSDSSNASSERVVNQLLTEMDGLESRKQVFVIAATNRPDMIDPAMLRPGRLDKLLYVPLPDAASRLSILTTITRQKKTPLDSDVDLKEVANDQRCEGFSGADLEALVREAAVTALKEGIILEQERDRQKYAENVNNNDENAKDSDAKGNSSSSSSNTNNTKKDLIICKVAKKHFEIAFTKVKPSVSPKDRQMYQSLQTMLRNYVASSS